MNAIDASVTLHKLQSNTRRDFFPATVKALQPQAFPDVLPYAAGEDDAMSWQREIAFMIEAAAWVSAEVSGLVAIVLAARLWSKRAPRTP